MSVQEAFIDIIQSNVSRHSPRVLASQRTHGPDRKLPKRHSAVAIILRVVKERNDEGAKRKEEVDVRQKQGVAEILFIKRSIREGDRWSGHIAFPGGHVEQGESPKIAAEREAMEEVGINLDSPDFRHVGQLDDRVIDIPRHKDQMVISTFVYIQTAKNIPALQLDPKEVAIAIWVPVSHFTQHDDHVHLTPHTLEMNLFQRSSVSQYLGLQRIHFPSVTLPHPAGHRKPPNVEYISGELTPDTKLVLWGLTLGITSELLLHENIIKTHLHHPTFTVDNPLVNAIMKIAHKIVRWRNPHRHPSVHHFLNVAALILAALVLLFAAAFAMFVLTR